MKQWMLVGIIVIYVRRTIISFVKDPEIIKPYFFSAYYDIITSHK